MDGGGNWYGDAYKSFDKLQKVQLKLDELMQAEEIDWDKEFTSVRVWDVAYDAAELESVRYRGSSSFAASYMVIDGLKDKAFIEVYKKSFRLFRVCAVMRQVVNLMLADGVELPEIKFEYDFKDVVIKSKRLRIYSPLYSMVSGMADDIQADTGYIVSLLVIAGSEKYRESYEKWISKLNEVQEFRYKEFTESAVNVALKYGNDDMIDRLKRAVGWDMGEIKSSWRVKNVNAKTVERLKKIAKMKKMRLGEVLDEMIFKCYPWIDTIFEQGGSR